ncbi:ABC transporter substrate-binding protein [Actinophytocola sp.]|uniref:ABC transporter substrate-binding protein n=1 Tax=Actinophytocola sp. TaxID=1872138 RepID=UPI003D6C4F20
MMRRFHARTPLRITVLAAAASIALAGCGGGSGSGTGEQTGGAAQITDECGEGGCDSNAVASWAYSTLPSTLVPYRSSDALDIPFLFAAYDRLTYTDTKGEIQPMLAKSWETPDDETLVMTIRDGVTFHDGAALNAGAVKANLDNTRSAKSTLASSLASITSVEVTGDMEVTVKVSGGLGSVLTTLSDRPGIIISPKAIGDDSGALERKSVGAGPYVLVENRPGDRLVYERFEDYWNPQTQHAAGLELRMIADDEARYRALQSGDVHIAHLREEAVDRVEGFPGVTVLKESAPRSYFMAINRSHPGLDKVEVRRAINQAINRDGIANGLLQGQCVPSTQLFQEGHPAYNENLDDEALQYDVDAAKKSLADAGETGFRFQMDVPNIPSVTILAEAVQADLKAAGITLDLNIVEVPALVERWDRGESDSYLGGFLADFDPSTVFASWFTAKGASNPSGQEPSGLTELVRQSQQPSSMAERAPMFEQITQAIADDAAAPLVLCTRYFLQGVREEVRNIQVFPHGQPDWRSVGLATGA